MTTESLGTKQCPRCLLAITEVSVVVTCESCGTAYHEECWKEQGGCVAPGCSFAPRASAAPVVGEMIGAIPPPPPPGFTPVGVPVEGALPVPADVSLGTAIAYGWNAITRHAGPLLLGALIFGVLHGILCIVPGLNFLYIFFGMAALQGGTIILAMKALRDDNPQPGDVFAGFTQYGRWMGVFWLFALIGMLCMLPVGITFGITLAATGLAGGGLAALGSSADFDSIIRTMGPAFAVSVLVMLVMIVIAIVVMVRWQFVYYLVAEGHGVLEAFGRSAEMTKGLRGRIFGITLVLGLIGGIGAAIIGGIIGGIFGAAGDGAGIVLQALASILSSLVALPWTLCTLTALYYAVKAQRGT